MNFSDDSSTKYEVVLILLRSRRKIRLSSEKVENIGDESHNRQKKIKMNAGVSRRNTTRL